ncbi:hypothetical protein [Desulfogranum japonicum]|uniref:hypothetical protein n=1 Tax=Desulfogranum japonicum TaxID=231447 RepID=UPI000403FAB9|nr:hypothetical protein [Desulfogranum japonicum]
MSQNVQLQTQLTSQKKKRSSTGQQKSTATELDKRTQPAFTPKRPVGKMLLFGALSLAAYGFLFFNEALVTKTFTLGGWHAAFPVMTAFLFSFVHGAFASNLLTVLGLEAKK